VGQIDVLHVRQQLGSSVVLKDLADVLVLPRGVLSVGREVRTMSCEVRERDVTYAVGAVGTIAFVGLSERPDKVA
jgi:hypothetical protein